jgi:flavodoxin
VSENRIIYATKTRHSKKIAEAIGKALDIIPYNIASRPVIKETDFLFIVGGIYGGSSLPELLEFVQNIEGNKVRKAVLITSCTAKKQGQDSVRSILEGKGIPVIDEILCQGSFLFMKMGHPNKTDITEAVNFAVSITQGAVK